MSWFLIKAILSGLVVAAVSEIARRNPVAGALVASIPLISVLAMIWLWSETADPARIAAHAGATFWYVLPSLPMFLLVPWLLRSGAGFWLSLLAGCTVTVLLYLAMIAVARRLGIEL